MAEAAEVEQAKPREGAGKTGWVRKAALRAAILLGVTIVVWVGGGVAIWCSAPEPPKAGEKFDAIIVLGSACDEGKPSESLEQRVRKGVALYEEGRAPVMIMTGRGRREVAESICARTLALELGVPASAILIEDKSMTTFGNAVEARKVTAGERVVVVRSGYHGYRAERLFRGLFDHVAFVEAPGSVKGGLWGVIREPAGVLKMWWSTGVPVREGISAANGKSAQ